MRYLQLLLLFPLALAAQGSPDCQWSGSLTTTGDSTSIQNRPTTAGGNAPCVSFRLAYWTNASSATSIELDGAADGVIAGVHGPTGSWTALTPAAGGGSGSGSTTNPATDATNGQINACCDYYPWLRVTVNTLTSSGAGTQVQWRVYGYKGTSARLNGGSGGGGAPSGPAGGDLAGSYPDPTVANLSNVSNASLANAGLVNASTTVNGTTCTLGASCTVSAGGTGNAASVVPYTPSSSVTLTCPSSTAGTVTVFSPAGTALAANMAITWASCTTGQDIRLLVKQAASGGPYTVTGLPTGAPQISPFASATTAYLFHATAATTVAFDNVAADSGPGTLTETAAPGTPPAGYEYLWADSTDHVLKSINPSAATANTVVGIANPSDSQAVNYIGTDGVQHRIAPASGALVLLEQHTASSSASLAFTTCISATYDTYEVTLVDLQTSTNANLEMQVSTDGGSTYDTTSGHYLTSADYTDGTLTTSSTGDGTTTMTWTTGLGSAYIVSGRFSFYNPGSASLAKLAAGMISVWSNTTALFNQRWTNVYKQTTAVNTFRLAASTGTLASGTARCYGIAK